MRNFLAPRLVRYLVYIGIVIGLPACVQSESTYHSVIPHYRIMSSVDSEPVHLQARGAPQWIVAVTGAPASSFDGLAAWRMGTSSESTTNLDSGISSLYEFLGDAFYLELNAEGTMQNLEMVTYTEKSEAGEWSFERQSSGRCFIKNKTLGSEFALTVDTSTTPYSVMMSPIDSALVQEWTIEAFLQPRYGFETLCNGIAS